MDISNILKQKKDIESMVQEEIAGLPTVIQNELRSENI